MEFNETWQKAKSQRPLPNLCFRADTNNKMAAPASDWLRHFGLLLWNRWTKFKETWREAISQLPLTCLCFSSRSEKQNGRPGLWFLFQNCMQRNRWCPSVMISQFGHIFRGYGRGNSRDVQSNKGSPIYSSEVKEYISAVNKEQAVARILPKQSKPVFLGKLKFISSFIKIKISLCLWERSILYCAIRHCLNCNFSLATLDSKSNALSTTLTWEICEVGFKHWSVHRYSIATMFHVIVSCMHNDFI